MSVIIYSNMFNVIILKRSVRFSIKIIKVWYYICKRSSIHPVVKVSLFKKGNSQQTKNESLPSLISKQFLVLECFRELKNSSTKKAINTSLYFLQVYC